MQRNRLSSNRPRTLWLLSWFYLLGAFSLMAAPIEVNNHSFEAPALGAGGWTNDLPPLTGPDDPQWQDPPDGVAGNRFVEFIGGFFSEGSQHIGMAAGHYIFQNLGIPYEANTSYTLTVGVGYRNPTQSGTESFTVIGLTALEGPPADDNRLGGATTGQLDADAFLSSASTRVESVTLNNAQERTFSDVTVEFTTDENPPSGNIVIFLGDDDGGGRSHFDNVRLDAVTALDPDGDGIPEEWETGTDRGVARGLDPNVDDGGEDPDGDTLTNFQEFQLGTHPRLADTDGDGLNDNFETTTDPLNPDSDGDTLLDGEEIATYQTDPNDTDSDDDTFEDQAEVAAGTDPNNPDSKPALGGAIRLGGNFVGGNATSPGAEVTGTAGVVPQDNWNNFPGGAGDPVIAIDSEGEPSLLRVSWQTNGPGVAGDEPTTPDEQLMFGLLAPRGDGTGGDDVISEIIVRNIAYPLYDLYLYFNSTDGGAAVYEANDEIFNVDVTPFDGTFVEVTEDGGSGNYIHFRNLTGSTLVMRGRTLGITGFQIEREKPADPSLLAIPDRLDFGELSGNSEPQELTFRILNPGESQTLNITGSTITGDGAAKYSVSGIPATLGPNEGADVTVTYNLTDEVGIDRGFLEITSNSAVGATSVIPLIGQIKHANGLVAHYKMDETEGTEMIDASGNGYNGIYVAGSGSFTLGSPALASGSAVAFNEGGDAAYGEVPSNIGLPTLAEGSYSFWVQQDAADLGTPSVLFSRSSSPANPYAVFIEEATEDPDPVIWTSEAATQTLVSEPFMVFDEPIHVVYTYSDPNQDGLANVALYVNGVLNASATGTSGYPLGTIAPFQIGGSAGQFGFTGVIDDFQIYERVLMEEDVAALFAEPGSTAPVPPAPEILIGYWPFDDQATETADASGSGNTGTVTGDAMFVAGHTGAAGDFAIAFDGVDDSVTTTSPLLDELEQYTIAGWINFEMAQPDRTGLFGQNDLVEFGISAGNTLQAWTSAEGTLSAPTPLADSTDGWVHVATVSGAQNRVLYIDGVEVARGAVVFPHNTSGFNFNIGGSGVWDDAGNWFNGLIDDVALFSVGLTDGEIASLADGSRTPLQIRQTVVLVDVTQPGDPVVVVSGENDGDANEGDPPAAEGVENAINDVQQKYLHFQDLGSGLIVTPSIGGTVLTGLRLYPANDAPERDPASYRLEGSVAGPDGPFELISEGALDLPLDRNGAGDAPIDTSLFHQEVSFTNTTAYLSYRLVFPTLRDAETANSMQIAEVEFLGVTGTVEPPVGGEDSDGDGVPDNLELIAGTDPNDPNSYLRVSSVDHLGDAGTELVWSSVDGKAYHIEYSVDLIAWTMITAAPIDAAAGTTSFTDNDAARLSEPEGYYRVVVAE